MRGKCHYPDRLSSFLFFGHSVKVLVEKFDHIKEKKKKNVLDLYYDSYDNNLLYNMLHLYVWTFRIVRSNLHAMRKLYSQCCEYT